MKLATILLGTLLLTQAPEAQRLAAQVENSFFPFGNVILRVYDTTGNGFQLASPCGDVDIHVGSPSGTPLPNPPSCGPGLTTVPPFGTFTYTWPPVDPTGTTWPDGEYWFRFRAIDPVTSQPFEELFSVRLNHQGSTIGVQGDVRLGNTYPINLFGGPAGAFYWMFLSRTSNQPIFYQGILWSISPDGLFFASLTNPLSVLSNSFGILDGTGAATGDLVVPPVMQLAYSGFVLQALILDQSTGIYRSTNTVYRRILP